MKIAILGSGIVGRTLAEKLIELKHEVAIGTRNTAKTLLRSEREDSDKLPFGEWIKNFPEIKLVKYAEAVRYSDFIINATNGEFSLSALKKVGEKNIEGKILMDISNPFDFSNGAPPSLFVSNTDSLGERIQHSFPSVRVVKALNTVAVQLMTHPSLVPGEHNIFIGGNDAEAKQQVSDLLASFGWSKELIIDLGDIASSRAMEQLLPLMLRLWDRFGHPNFNIKVVVGKP